MSITLREILAVDALRQARVVAGQAGLDRELKWVTVVEVLDEIDALQEGELLITTAFGLSDNEVMFNELTAGLVKRKLAGLAIQIGYYLHEIPTNIIQQCNDNDFPLLVLPKQLIFSDITMAITKQIISRQMQLLEYSQRIHNRLTQVILRNEGMPQIAQVLSELLNAPVRIFDRHYNLLSHAGLAADSALTHPDTLEAEYSYLKKRKLLTADIVPPIQVPLSVATPFQYLQPMFVGKEAYGYISVLTTKPALEEMDKIAIESAATISTLEILKAKAVRETEERIKGDFLDELLENTAKATGVLQRRATYLGFSLEKKFAVLCLSLDCLPAMLTCGSEEQLQEMKYRLFKSVRFFLQSYQQPALLKYKNNRLVILLQVDGTTGSNGTIQAAEQLKRFIQADTKCTVSIGAGRAYSELSDIHKSYAEAENALMIGSRLRKSNSIFAYENLCPYNLFANSTDQKEIQEYYRRTVAPLIEYDRHHSSNLIATLEAFCRCNYELKATAQELFIHRHTLKYRLHRIYELTGFNPLTAQDCFQLQLGLIVARLLAEI